MIKSKPFIFLAVGFLMILSVMNCKMQNSIKLDPDSQDFYEYARLIMTKAEKDIFKHLPDKTSRDEFMQDFWAKRDPAPETEENEFKEEFFRRIEYANARFKEGIPGWKTDRGRMYIYLGPPDKIDERVITQYDPGLSASDRASRGPIVFWIYYRYNFGVKFVDRNGTGSYRFDPYYGTSGSIFDAMERAKLGSLPDNLEKSFVDFKIDFEKATQEVVVSIPVKALIFRGEGDKVETDFDFKFYVYSKNSSEKKVVTDKRHFESDEKNIVKKKYITFRFPFNLEPGKYYFDTIISSPDVGKTRKIVEVKISAGG